MKRVLSLSTRAVYLSSLGSYSLRIGYRSYFPKSFLHVAAGTSLLLHAMSTSSKEHTPTNTEEFTYLSADQAKLVDERLMSDHGFSIDQLMELAGYSVACATSELYNKKNGLKERDSPKVLILAGPGNNGGDGLVAARHLKHFGYDPTIIYPKPGKTPLFSNLVTQCKNFDITIEENLLDENTFNSFDVVVDALFGFSFKGPSREPFSSLIDFMKNSKIPVISVDIPSGWHVEEGDTFSTGFTPNAVISLTAPKKCMLGFSGVHYVGGRFMPPVLAKELDIVLPNYGVGSHQILELSSKPLEFKQSNEELSAIFITTSSSEEAKKIAKSLLEKKLIACANLVPKVESIYEWEGKIEESTEVLMMIKTRKSLISAVTAEVKLLHSYDVPETISVDLTGGNPDYLDWVVKNTQDTKK